MSKFANEAPQYTTVEIFFNLLIHSTIMIFTPPYEAPELKVFKLTFKQAILTGSEYGAAGQAGSSLDVLDELSF